MKSVFAAGIKNQDLITHFISHFDQAGKILVAGRNTIKLFEDGDITYAVKAFRKPNIFNAIAYRFIRKSKARRSFEFAQKLLTLGIGTPAPIAYFEERGFLFGKSYYCSLYHEPDLLFKDLVANPNYPNHEQILREFTQFTFALHEKKVEFLDHTPGNTLIIRQDSGKYQFLLVDLNRMLFDRHLSFDDRMKNICRLTPHRDMVNTMASEYAKHYHQPVQEVERKLWEFTLSFQKAFQRKKALKKKLRWAK